MTAPVVSPPALRPDILAKIIHHRRTLTAEIRDLADAARLPI